jgi:hypothetical protein
MMKLKQLCLALLIVTFALTAQFAVSSPANLSGRQSPPMTKATPKTGAEMQNSNEDAQSQEMIKMTEQCVKDAYKDYRKCLKRGRKYRSSCRRKYNEQRKGCSG